MHGQSPKYRNPVVLKGVMPGESYIPLATSLQEFGYREKVVGFSERCFYVCTSRRANSGYYEMIAEGIPWASTSSVRYGRFFSIWSVTSGLALILLASLSSLSVGSTELTPVSECSRFRFSFRSRESFWLSGRGVGESGLQPNRKRINGRLLHCSKTTRNFADYCRISQI